MVGILAERASKLELLIAVARGGSSTSTAASSGRGYSRNLPCLPSWSSGGVDTGGAGAEAWPAAGAAAGEHGWPPATDASATQQVFGGMPGPGTQPQPHQAQHQRPAAGVGGCSGADEEDGAAHMARCCIPNCRRCAYEVRRQKLRSEQLQRRQQQQEQKQQQQPQQPQPPPQQQPLPGGKQATSAELRAALHSPQAVGLHGQRVPDLLDSAAAEGGGFHPAADAMAPLEQRQRPDGGYAAPPLPSLQQQGSSTQMSVLEAVLESMPAPLPDLGVQGLPQGQAPAFPPSPLPPLPIGAAAVHAPGADHAALA